MMLGGFFGLGAASMVASFTQGPWQLAAALMLIGVFASIYHPVGTPMLLQSARGSPSRIVAGQSFPWQLARNRFPAGTIGQRRNTMGEAPATDCLRLLGAAITMAAIASCAHVQSHNFPVDRRDVVRNAIDMRFVPIPAGEFMMGSEQSADALAARYPTIERARLLDLADQTPVHRVRITRPFLLGAHEVTVGEFRAFIDQSGYVPESIRDRTGGYGYRADYDPARTERHDVFEGRDPKYSWLNPGFVQSDNHPVVNVTWNDANAMARWLGEIDGHRYRLPTEAEWEYAARAGTGDHVNHYSDTADIYSAFPHKGNVFDLDSAQHWPQWRGQAMQRHDGFEFTAPVASFAPNAFGVYDMIGNVWEWTADRYAPDAYANASVDDPVGPTTGGRRVRRGGSWHTWPFYARPSYRNWNTPDTRYVLVGFRLVREEP